MGLWKNIIAKIFSDKLKIYGTEQKYLFLKLPFIGKYSARIKRDLKKILKDYGPYTKLRLISYPSIKIGHLFKKSLGQILFRYISNVVYKTSRACGHSYIGQTCCRIPDRVREHKDALTKPSRFSYLAENSIKMRLPSHLDSHIWLKTVRIPDTTSIGSM